MLNEENCPYIDGLCGTHAQCRDCDSSGRLVVHSVHHYKHHNWRRNKKGEIDFWAFESGFCNGPRCERCHAYFCEHCVDDPDKELAIEWDCVVEFDSCPWCDHTLKGIDDNWKNCPYCGKRINVERRRNFEFRHSED